MGKKKQQDEPTFEFQSCSNSFDEHHLFPNQVAERFADSNINISRLNLSQGKEKYVNSIQFLFKRFDINFIPNLLTLCQKSHKQT